MFALVIVVDVLGTIAVIAIVSKCTKEKSSAGLTHTPKGKNHADQEKHTALHYFTYISKRLHNVVHLSVLIHADFSVRLICS